jgi:uncharacterized FlgJ-related protein
MRTLVAALLLAAVASTGWAEDKPIVKPSAKPVDLVICLDVSGSMQGLIDSAKLKLWDIVNELGTVKPTPKLRVALYSYGGQGGEYTAANGYTRKEVDLTTDLDKVYEKLNALRITGHEEYVTGVSKRALTEQDFSKEKNALKVIFVCGNESASQDPNVKLADLAKLTKEMDVIVNTIYCGPENDDIAPGYKAVAEQCGGRFASINMDKAKHTVVATPFDKELNDLSGKLNGTYLFYGKAHEELKLNQGIQDENAKKAAPGAGAARAATKGGDLYRNTQDVIDKLAEDPKFDVSKLKDDELPAELKKLTPEERTALIKKKTEERAELQKQIKDLATKRAKHIEEETRKAPKDEKEKSLDEALKATIRTQAKEKGFELTEKK